MPLAFILLGLVIYQYGYLRIQTKIATIKDEQTIKAKTLEKYIKLISEKPQLEKKLASLKESRKADESKLIGGQTSSLAAATLQDTVKGIITGKGGTIHSEQIGKPEDLGKFKAISASISMVLPDSRTLSEVLYSIETRTPYLVVKEVDTRVRNFRDPRDLMVKIDISALYGGK